MGEITVVLVGGRNLCGGELPSGFANPRACSFKANDGKRTIYISAEYLRSVAYAIEISSISIHLLTDKTAYDKVSKAGCSSECLKKDANPSLLPAISCLFCRWNSLEQIAKSIGYMRSVAGAYWINSRAEVLGTKKVYVSSPSEFYQDQADATSPLKLLPPDHMRNASASALRFATQFLYLHELAHHFNGDFEATPQDTKGELLQEMKADAFAFATMPMDKLSPDSFLTVLWFDALVEQAAGKRYAEVTVGSHPGHLGRRMIMASILLQRLKDDPVLDVSDTALLKLFGEKPAATLRDYLQRQLQ
jgi:hypothetical protein